MSPKSSRVASYSYQCMVLDIYIHNYIVFHKCNALKKIRPHKINYSFSTLPALLFVATCV